MYAQPAGAVPVAGKFNFPAVKLWPENFDMRKTGPELVLYLIIVKKFILRCFSISMSSTIKNISWSDSCILALFHSVQLKRAHIASGRNSTKAWKEVNDYLFEQEEFKPFKHLKKDNDKCEGDKAYARLRDKFNEVYSRQWGLFNEGGDVMFTLITLKALS